MSDTPKPSFATMSYSFEMRGELPGNMGLFYQDAGTARDALEASRRELPGTPFTPVKDAVRASGEATPQQKWRTPNHTLPDPHPSFAEPNRKLREESWFQTLRTHQDGKAMTRAEFEKARKSAVNPRARNRSR